MIFKVTASGYKRHGSDQPFATHTEEVDTETNELFKHCTDTDDVRRKYESFWNDLNPNSEDVVYVDSVEKVYPKQSPDREFREDPETKFFRQQATYNERFADEDRLYEGEEQINDEEWD